jgi:hypothetical protein
MRIIVNDTSCLVDLRKAGLLHATLLLPYSFQIALPLVHNELTDFTRAEIEDLTKRGLQVIDLPAEGVARALTFRSAYPALSFNDCLSMALAESQPGSILLTGDQGLRHRASTIGIEVHGVLWVSDQLETGGHITFADLRAGLLKLDSDPLVFVPRTELANRLARLAKLLGT